MNVFKDNAGREWTVAITVGSIMRVRETIDVDLLDLVDGKLIEKLLSDPILLCKIIYVVCQPDAEKRGVSGQQFFDAMSGDDIDQATKILIDELVSFSPSPKDRANLRAIADKTNEAMDRGRDLVKARVQSGILDKIIKNELSKAEKKMDQAMEEVLSDAGEPSGNSQESLVSTRALTP